MCYHRVRTEPEVDFLFSLQFRWCWLPPNWAWVLWPGCSEGKSSSGPKGEIPLSGSHKQTVTGQQQGKENWGMRDIHVVSPQWSRTEVWVTLLKNTHQVWVIATFQKCLGWKNKYEAFSKIYLADPEYLIWNMSDLRFGAHLLYDASEDRKCWITLQK